MESIDQAQAAGTIENRPALTLTFEVVRRADFVFEPFMGSLMHLPEVRMHRAQSSEFFLGQTSPRVEAAGAAVEERLVWASPPAVEPVEQVLPAQGDASPAQGDVLATPPTVQPKKEKKRSAKEQNGPRFYHPQGVRFFDPVAAAAEEGEGGEEALELLGPRPSTELSSELKAAILRIDEQRRQMQQQENQEKPEKPVQGKKWGLLKARPSEVEEVPIEIVSSRNVHLTERAARWNETSAPQATSGTQPMASVPASEVKQAVQAVDASNQAPAIAMEQIATKSAALPQAAAQKAVAADKAPNFETSAFLDPLPASINQHVSLPIVAAGPSSPAPAQAGQKDSEPEFPSTKLPGAINSPISRLRRADLVKPAEPAVLQTPLVEAQAEIEEVQEPPKKAEKRSVAKRLQRLMGKEEQKLDGDRRRAARSIMPGLVAFYWSGGTPKPYEIVNISQTGFYVKTTDFWSAETLVRMSLERPAADGKRKGESISVLARVVRIDEGGVGQEFVTTEALISSRALDVMPGKGTDWRELDGFLQIQ